MMCCATSGVIFSVPLALVLGPGLEMVPEEEDYFCLCSIFCYFARVKFFFRNASHMVNFEFDGNWTEPDKSICKGQSCQMIIACLHYQPV